MFQPVYFCPTQITTQINGPLARTFWRQSQKWPRQGLCWGTSRVAFPRVPSPPSTTSRPPCPGRRLIARRFWAWNICNHFHPCHLRYKWFLIEFFSQFRFWLHDKPVKVATRHQRNHVPPKIKQMSLPEESSTPLPGGGGAPNFSVQGEEPPVNQRTSNVQPTFGLLPPPPDRTTHHSLPTSFDSSAPSPFDQQLWFC